MASSSGDNSGSNSSNIAVSMISFNMHGFHQGRPVLDDIIPCYNPDIILLQEHWLTPVNLCKFDDHFVEYFSFGSSAMVNAVDIGMLYGRPFGGVMTLIKRSLRTVTETIFSSDRFLIIKVGDCLVINVYLPCVGTSNRQLICEDIFADIYAWCVRYSDCKIVVAGDFNVNLDCSDSISRIISSFVDDCSLLRCDDLFPSGKVPTYVNISLKQQSHIDYILGSSACAFSDFSVIEPDINFSDHLPLFATFKVCLDSASNKKGIINEKRGSPKQSYLRWDKADRTGYYRYTGDNLAALTTVLDAALLNNNICSVMIDQLYEAIVYILKCGDNLFVPRHDKKFFKFWWNEELSMLKKVATESHRAWVAAGRPRAGFVFDSRQQSRMRYRKKLRESEQQSTLVYSNDLHDSLLCKNGAAFWKCWRAKFEHSSRCVEVEKSVDSDVIVGKFASHFSSAYTPNNPDRAAKILDEYLYMRASYVGLPLRHDQVIDTELVSTVILRLQNGKAPDIAGLTAEHLIHSHPAISVVLCKLFKAIMKCGYVPVGFRHGYIVPIPKVKQTCGKSLSCDDFRGIAISPLIAKVFEHCLLHIFQECFVSCDSQFGFKKGTGCRNAIYTARTIVDRIVEGGDTVNMCAIDLSKAFDKVNHKSLFMKLMKRYIPLQLLELLENWLSDSFACVKWGNSWSELFKISFGVRQGSVLSPVLFAVYIDDVCKLQNNRIGTFIVLYADDILLMARSLTELQNLLWACEVELESIDMAINVKKSNCLRIGARRDAVCSNIQTLDGREIVWVDVIRYLGVYIVRSFKFKCSVDHAKRSFFRAANGIFAKVGRIASEEVLVQLLKHKCLPVMLYGLEVCNLDNRSMQSLDFSFNRFFMKLFKTSSIDTVQYCQSLFGCKLPSTLLKQRFEKFVNLL